MKNIILVISAIILLTSCEKERTYQKLSDKEVYSRIVEDRLVNPKDVNDYQRGQAREWVNLDSLIQTGYWLWYDIIPNGTVTSYAQGEFETVVCDSAFMRFGVTGYGMGWFRPESASSAFKLGVQHWPSGSIVGAEILELFSFNNTRTWVLRKDVMPSGMGLAFCTAFDGFANEGSQTGTIETYHRDPDGFFYLTDASNSTSCDIRIYDAYGEHLSSITYAKFHFSNPQNPNADYLLPCSSAHLKCTISITSDEYPIMPNAYIGNFRSQYMSTNPCNPSGSYVTVAGDPAQGEFLNY